MWVPRDSPVRRAVSRQAAGEPLKGGCWGLSYTAQLVPASRGAA